MKKIKNPNDPFSAELFSLVIPIGFQFLMTALVSVSDALMLGFVDQTSLAAVSLATQIQFVFSLFVTGIAAGLSLMIAQYWGKKDIRAIEAVASPALLVNLIIGVLFTGAAWFFPRELMRAFTNERELIAAGEEYLYTVALSYVLMGISQIYLAVLKNTGRAKAASVISSCAMFFNIFGNLLLIFGLCGLPRMGIRGAALATVITRAIELIWSVLESYRVKQISVKWKFKRFNRILMQDFVHYTAPVLAASLVWGIAFALHSVVLGHMGSDAVAANSIASIAKQLLSCVLRGVGGAAGIMVGKMLGSGDLEKGKTYGARFLRLSIFVGIGTGLAMIVLSPAITRFATISDSAKEYLQGMMIFLGIWVMAQCINHVVLDGVFVAGGDVRFDMITNIIVMWCISLPLGFLAAFVLNLGVIPVFVLINLDEIIKLPAIFLRYRKYLWVRDITRDQIE